MLLKHRGREVYIYCFNCELAMLKSFSSHKANMIVRLSLLRKTILIPEYLAFMCVCVFVDGCISQF